MAMQLEFGGKRIFVAGGAVGLGRRISAAFHDLGAMVAINGRSAAEVEQAIGALGGGTRLLAAPGSLCETEERRGVVARAIEALRGLDVLVCAPMAGSVRQIEDITLDYWQRIIEEGPKSAFFVAQACVAALRETRGVIVNVASAIGLVGGPQGVAAYAAASGAIVQMSRMMALELAAEGIRVNTVCPAWPEGDSSGASAVLREYFRSRSPLHRVASADECAAAVLYACAAASAYTTGAVLVADGGITSGHYVG